MTSDGITQGVVSDGITDGVIWHDIGDDTQMSIIQCFGCNLSDSEKNRRTLAGERAQGNLRSPPKSLYHSILAF